MKIKIWHLVLAALIVMVTVFGLAPEEAMNLIRETMEFLRDVSN